MAHWFVVRTNIKCEDKAERNLALAGFQTYAPWQRFESYNRRKRVFIDHARRLAPRYLFLCVDDPDNVPWGTIRGCEGVEYILGVEGRPVPLNGYETRKLLAIMAAERNYEFDETRAGKLHRREIGRTRAETTKLKFPVGSRVKAMKGPFQGLAGKVLNVNGRGQVEALFSLFQGKVPVEIPADDLEIVANHDKAA